MIYEGAAMKKSDKGAILGLIRAIADQALDSNMPASRERGKYEQLQKAVDREFRRCQLSVFQRQEALRKVGEFGEQTGWEGKGKNHGTVLSFLLGVMDEYDGVFSDRITEIMRELVEHIENIEELPGACYWGGGLAAEKLREVLE